MARYRAQMGGIEGSGQYMSPSGAVDFGGIVQALGSSATSLIQGAYARKLAQKNADAAAAQLAQQNTFKERELQGAEDERKARRLDIDAQRATRLAEIQQRRTDAIDKEARDRADTDRRRAEDRGEHATHDAAAAAAAAETARHNRAVEGADQWTAVQGTDPETGQPSLIYYNKKTGQPRITPGTGKPGGAGGGGGTVLQQARLGVGKVDLEQAHGRMQAFENDVVSGKETISPTVQAKGTAASTKPSDKGGGALSPILNAAGSYVSGKAAESLGKTNARYAQYLNDKKLVGEAVLSTAARGSDDLRRFEMGIAGTDAGWTPEIITALQARRQGILDNVFKRLVPSGPAATPAGRLRPVPGSGGRGGSAAAPTPDQSLWDAAVAKHGQAKVLQEYGPRPQ